MPFDTITKVALAGASGPAGQAILAELLKSELFDITVLTRDSSTSTHQSLFAPAVKTIQIDYTSLDSLTSALTGQEALVSAISPTAILAQKLLIDAAIRAKVRRFLPSSYTYDLCSPSIRNIPTNNNPFTDKIAIEQYLIERATKSSLSYTFIYCGPILDLGLKSNLFFDFPNRTATLHQNSAQLFSTTKLSNIGKAVRRVLTHPRETANRPVRIKDIDVSQKQLLEIAQSLTPGQDWDIKTIEKTDSNSTFPSFGGTFERVHNDIFGIKQMSEANLEELIRDTFEEKA